MKIKYLLSDLDGVIRTYPEERDRSIEQRYGLQTGSIHSHAFEKHLLAEVVCGRITDEVWRIEIVKSLAKVCGKKAAVGAVREWSDFPGKLDSRYLEYVDKKFSKIPLLLLTNGTTRLMSDLNKLGIQDQFYKIFNSAEIGICKPDQKIYRHVVEQLGCHPSEILFIDDSISHVQAAQEFGIVSYHYKSFEEFQNGIMS